MDFIFIGPGKTGSTWLRENLLREKEISLSKEIKETNFFLKKSINNYSKFFNYFDKSKPIFDIGNTYIYNDDLSFLLNSYPRDFTLIFAYRNTIDRLISMFRFDKKSGLIPQDTTLSEALIDDKYNLISKSIISPKLKTLISNNFNLIYWNYENFKIDQKKEYLNLLASMGIKNHNDQINTAHINKAKKLRNKYLSYISRPLANNLRKYKFYRLLNFFKTNIFFHKLVYVDINKNENLKSEISESIIKLLMQEDLELKDILNN